MVCSVYIYLANQTTNETINQKRDDVYSYPQSPYLCYRGIHPQGESSKKTRKRRRPKRYRTEARKMEIKVKEKCKY